MRKLPGAGGMQASEEPERVLWGLELSEDGLAGHFGEIARGGDFIQGPKKWWGRAWVQPGPSTTAACDRVYAHSVPDLLKNQSIVAVRPPAPWAIRGKVTQVGYPPVS